MLFNSSKSSFQMKVHFAFHLVIIKVQEAGERLERHRGFLGQT